MKYLDVTGKLPYHKETFPVGTSEAIMTGTKPVSVFVNPTGSVNVEITAATETSIQVGTADWFAWPKGIVSDKANDGLLLAVSAVRFIVTTADCVCEVLGTK